MGQKIKLSSNIPINLPETLSHNKFGLGFLYYSNSGKGFHVQEGTTWFEKLCLSLNKINSIVGFQNSNLKIPEYIAQTISVTENQIEDMSLVVRYNAQTKVNDFIGSLAPQNNKVSFDDQSARSLTKGTPMVILGERRLKTMLLKFEENFGLDMKIKFILNHEIAHNIDCSRKYKRGKYSIKDIMESHIGSRLSFEDKSPFVSNTEFDQTKKMIKQLWTLSLEHYADTLGFLNMRNQLLSEGMAYNKIETMLDGIIEERKTSFIKNIEILFDKNNNINQGVLNFEDRYKYMTHFTVTALIELKDKLKDLKDITLSVKDIEHITINTVTKSDLMVLHVLQKLDNKSSQLLEKIFTSKVNADCYIYPCDSKKPEFENKIKDIVGQQWITQVDKFILANKEKNTLYNNISLIFINNSEQLKEINQINLTNKIKNFRSITTKYKIDKKIKRITP